jgi:hypothetical protein
VRVFHLAVFSNLLVLSGCGYVGPVLPPSAEIPAQVMDLTAVQRGDKIDIAFRTPPRTTDNVAVRHFSEIDLRIGPASVPFDFAAWAETAKQYPLPPPPPVDPADPQPIAMTTTIPVAGLLDKRVAVAVRTAIKNGDHYSSWSNRVVLNVTSPLNTPAQPTAAASADGVVLDWLSVAAAKSYRILRQGPSDKSMAEVGKVEETHFVDKTAQFDTPYSYEVIAGNGDAESQPSEIAKIMPVDTFPPSVPIGVNALAGPESIEVSWQRSPEADLAGYYIYRSVDNGEFERQGDLAGLPAYSDRRVEHGKGYRYQISSVDKKNNESARSAAAQVAF